MNALIDLAKRMLTQEQRDAACRDVRVGDHVMMRGQRFGIVRDIDPNLGYGVDLGFTAWHYAYSVASVSGLERACAS